MDLKELGKKIISYGAPLLGMAVAGPGGAAVAAKLVSEFGANDVNDLVTKFTQDPQTTLKLKEIESQERIRLEELANQLINKEIDAEVADRTSARDLAKANGLRNDNTTRNLAYMLVIGSFVILVLIPFLNPDAGEKELMAAMITLLITETKDCLRLFFGRSFRADN